jgi:NADP-dependent 3-hydroxy acid dehydrogenase YdfG
MPTIAIVGAGPGLGLSVAKVFGANGFKVALISRNQDRLDALVAQLAESGVTSASFRADASHRAALTVALEQAAAQLGTIDVLEYSPHGGLATVHPPEVTVANLAPQIEHLLYGAVTATNTVLPAMQETGTGTLLYTTGGGAITPYPMLATVNAAQAALRNWVLNLNGALADTGVYAATVAINLFIGATAPEGVPHADPDDIAAAYWKLHTDRNQAELLISAG